MEEVEALEEELGEFLELSGPDTGKSIRTEPRKVAPGEDLGSCVRIPARNADLPRFGRESYGELSSGMGTF